MGRPVVPILAQDAIVAAAMDLVAHKRDFTMTDLAAKLGVRPSSLYNHVRAKSQVINLIRSHWLGDLIEESSRVPQGTERIIAMMRGFYLRALQAPRLIPLLFIEPLIERESLRFYEEIAQSVLASGAQEQDIPAIIAMVDGFVLGSALDASAPSFEIPAGDESLFPALRTMIGAKSYPSQRGIEDFEIGLKIFAAGLSARISHGSRTPSEN